MTSELQYPFHPMSTPLNWQSVAQQIMKACSDAVLLVGETGMIIYFNPVASKALNVQPGDCLADTVPELWMHVQKALHYNGDSFNLTIKINGFLFRTWIEKNQIEQGYRYAICVLENRSEFEEVYRRMHNYQELSQELNAIIASSDDGLWVCDSHGKVLRINAASERINLVRAEDVLGRSMHDLQAEGFIDRSVTLEVLKTRRRQNLIQKTSSGRKLILTGNPVFNDVGEVVRVVVNERDITEIDALSRKLEEQVAIEHKMRHQILEMQLAEITADSLIARSPAMINVLQQALKLGQVKTTVLIMGESGTGKGILAKLIHKYSDRVKNPMIGINCGAIPENLVETELFGYEKGAFTGADQKGKPGYLELAHRGTLFLDEIAELPLSSQVKLLRFLENNQVTRVGGTSGRKVDVRIICATHQDLSQMMADGRFRKDLYYRLHVIPVRMPPLRERKACILPLVRHYLDHFCKQLGRHGQTQVSREAMDVLLAYSYPGNVRELVNLCERLVVMTEGREIGLEDLPVSVLETVNYRNLDAIGELCKGQTLAQMLATAERRILSDAYRQYGSQTRMAEALGVNQSTIARKMKKYR